MCKLLWGVCCIYILKLNLYINIWHVIAYDAIRFFVVISMVIAEVVWFTSTTWFQFYRVRNRIYRTKHPNIRHCFSNDRFILINPWKTHAAALRLCLAYCVYSAQNLSIHFRQTLWFIRACCRYCVRTNYNVGSA